MEARKWTREKNRNMRNKMLEQDADTRGFHSWSYHRHFEGYTEYRRLQTNGSIKLIREYTGKWYQQKLTRKKQVGLRLIYLILFSAMVLFFILAGTSAGKAGATWYSAIIGFATIVCMTAEGYVILVNYLFSPFQMTIGEFRSTSGSLKFSSIGSTICALLGAFASVLYAILHLNEKAPIFTVSILEYLICAAIACLIYTIERRVKYEILDNHTPVPDDGVEITA